MLQLLLALQIASTVVADTCVPPTLRTPADSLLTRVFRGAAIAERSDSFSQVMGSEVRHQWWSRVEVGRFAVLETWRGPIVDTVDVLFYRVVKRDTASTMIEPASPGIIPGSEYLIFASQLRARWPVRSQVPTAPASRT